MSFEGIPTRFNADEILASWFNDLRDAGVSSPTWTLYSIPYTDLQTAALTKTNTIFTLAAKQAIEGIIIKTKTVFAGTLISSLLFDIGRSGDSTRWLAGYSGLAAVANSNYESQSMLEVPSFTNTIPVQLAVTAIGANLSALSAGELEIWIKTGTLS